MTRKLTLSADEQVIRKAKRLAARQGTSVSAMFARMVCGMAEAEAEPAPGEVPENSIAARASGFIRLPRGKTPRDVLTEALMERHGIKA
jgi:hypothetical protein